jgi:glycosyltransferase involved in cell wall biosynthesis
MRKVGIDCQKILTSGGAGAGTEHYIWHLVKELANNSERTAELVLFFDPQVKGSGVAEELSDFSGVSYKYYPATAVTRQGWWPYTKYKIQRDFIKKYDLDLWHGPANVTPLLYRGRTVVTIHDLIIYEHPEWFPGGVADWFWRAQVVPQSIKKAARVIAVSNFTKQQVRRHFHKSAELIDVIYEGVTAQDRAGETGVLAKHQIEKPYFLFLATIEPRKNLVRLITAFAQLSKKYPKFSLVIAGKNGWKYEEVFTTVKRLDLDKNVIFTGYTSQAEKTALYRDALAFVFPSLAEGFGLPVLDAMQAGVPVLTSNNTSLIEVAGEAALKVDPWSEADIYQGLEKLAQDDNLRTRLISLGRKQAQKFSWEKAARQTLATYNQALGVRE